MNKKTAFLETFLGAPAHPRPSDGFVDSTERHVLAQFILEKNARAQSSTSGAPARTFGIKLFGLGLGLALTVLTLFVANPAPSPAQQLDSITFSLEEL